MAQAAHAGAEVVQATHAGETVAHVAEESGTAAHGVEGAADTEKAGHAAQDGAHTSQATHDAREATQTVKEAQAERPVGATGQLRPAEPIPNAGPPATRHYADRVRQNTVAKNQNTIIKPGTDIAPDLEAIRSGKAMRDGSYRVVGDRYYGVHENGTVYPVSGSGLAPLDRGAFKALGVYNTHGVTPEAEAILDRMGISSAQRQAARDAGAKQ